MFSSRNKDKTSKKSKDVIDHTVDGVDQAQGTTAAATGGGAGADASGGRAHIPQPQRYLHQELIDGINNSSTIISIPKHLSAYTNNHHASRRHRRWPTLKPLPPPPPRRRHPPLPPLL